MVHDRRFYRLWKRNCYPSIQSLINDMIANRHILILMKEL